MIILKLKNAQGYYKNTVDGDCYNTWSIDFARRFKCEEEIKGQIKVNIDKYEIIEIE